MRSGALRAALLLLLLVAAAGCRSALPPDGEQKPRHRIIAYVRGRAEIDRIGAHKLTHVNYAFAKVSARGEVVLDDPDAPAHLARLQALKAKNPRLRILLSVGGWGADHFSDAALDEASRERFAASAIELVRRYALDGIDLDWEYPGQPGPGIGFRAEDRENFTRMLETMRRHLDRLGVERERIGDDSYLLTIASSGGVYFEHTEMDRVHEYLDWINVMTYDFAGSWSPTTGHHAALYGDPGAPESRASAAAFVRQHLAAGIPAIKLVLGVPFYGRAWTGVRRENHGLYQPYESPGSGDYSYSSLRRDYIDRNGFRRLWDPVARAPYLWNEETATLVSYDDPVSLREKARFIEALGLGGVMYWEHSHDPEERLLDVLYDNLK
ncbi:MAG TPA: glycoside hydrolase family 18 protein [Thermoanaerobaculia bacterium]|nr:glycoside hydrolase family 18 protein [Thermoanaerobaculia bacterium]